MHVSNVGTRRNINLCIRKRQVRLLLFYTRRSYLVISRKVPRTQREKRTSSLTLSKGQLYWVWSPPFVVRPSEGRFLLWYPCSLFEETIWRLYYLNKKISSCRISWDWFRPLLIITSYSNLYVSSGSLWRKVSGPISLLNTGYIVCRGPVVYSVYWRVHNWVLRWYWEFEGLGL